MDTPAAIPRSTPPADIIRRIALILRETSSSRTLANLQQCSHLAYEVVNPILYRELLISAATSAGILNIGRVDGFEGFDEDGESTFEGTVGTLRRLASLRHVRRLVIRSLPPDFVSVHIIQAATTLRGHLLFPRLQYVNMLPDAIDGLRVWTPDSYDRPRNPPFLEAVALSSRPSHLCLAFRLVPSILWEEHRELSLSGQHQLVSKVTRLCKYWKLRAVHYHDIVHQVLPSVEGCRNVYHFAPHVIPHPYIHGRFRFPTGREAVRIPGPEWNIRPWQMSVAIKNLFPSGGHHDSVLQDTTWVFCELSNHILTKEFRDDDDGTGVWWEEVDGMVKSSVRVGLSRDLQAREGVDEKFVDNVFTHVGYEHSTVCDACERDPSQHQVGNLAGL